ncbi:sensor histidine kinase [Actinomycetospora aeridis]|uniref:histidine kinase n=1 Tax=Actinomycetospora aeridis TaxID=3129231 RepID=A0ABU8N3L2_9PSEU
MSRAEEPGRTTPAWLASLTRDAVGGAARATVGVVLGGVLAVAVVPVAVGALLAAPVSRAVGRRWLRVVVTADRRRLRRWHGHASGEAPVGDRAAAGYLAVRVVTGTAALVLVVIGGAVAAGYLLVPPVLLARGDVPAATFAPSVGVGVVALLLTAQVIAASAALDRRLAARLLDGDPTAMLRRRVRELAASRADVVAAVDDERRRIGRDLHDGVQQRVVALAMLLGRAQHTTDAEQAGGLHQQAHRDARALIGELREVAWRVYPTELDEAGLDAALESLVDRVPHAISLRNDLVRTPARGVALAVYYTISEAVTNAVKHAHAEAITVEVGEDGDTLVARVRDDGRGGADPAGSGLAGLAGRLAALDGRLVVDSPVGGPTVVAVEIPCG